MTRKGAMQGFLAVVLVLAFGIGLWKFIDHVIEEQDREHAEFCQRMNAEPVKYNGQKYCFRDGEKVW